MRQNLDALMTELEDAINRWNEFTDDGTGHVILSEDEATGYAHALYELMISDMHEMEQIQ